MMKLSNRWKQQKRLNPSNRNRTTVSQQTKSYLKEIVDYGNDGDDEFLNEVFNEWQEKVATSPMPRPPKQEARHGKRQLSHFNDNDEMSQPDNIVTNVGTVPEVITNKELQLSSLNLPALVLQQYEKCGIKTMFRWQSECLRLDRVLSGRNLVYSAPTSAGKTLVAEILMLKCVVEQRKKALMILPFVSVTREKVYYLQTLFQSSGIRVDGFMGNHAPAGGFDLLDIAVCTIEKANGLVNRLIEENTIGNLGIVVVDELHMIGDPHRGYLLELLLTKLLYLQKRCTDKPDSIPSVPQPIQIVGMSATLPNLKLLADWLNAGLYCTDFRPVPLSERLKIGNVVYCARTMKAIQNFVPSLVPEDTDHVMQMCIESIASNQGVLIFCPTKSWCERLAESIARTVNEVGRQHRQSSQNAHGLARYHESLRANLSLEDITQVLDHLRKSPAGLDQVLAKTVALGVAFHHAGLTFDEREIIEGAFRRGAVKVLTATSTLSSGVNLPARRVIVRTPIFHGATINLLTYQQMIGRAGRTGLDIEGESILICKENERTRAETLAQSSLPPVSSCLSISGQTVSSSLKRAMLEILVSGAATSETEALQYTSCTLLEASLRQNDTDVKSPPTIQNCLKGLIENEFVKESISGSEDRVFSPTLLGKAVLASSLSPDEGLVVYEELERARRCFVLENDLHVVYQVTPLNVSDQWPNMDWRYYLRLWEQLSVDKRRVAECVGVEERFIIFAMNNEASGSSSQRRNRLLRFYAALALLDLVNEIPLPKVAAKYNCNRGMLQSLQQSAATFAGMVTVFCHHLGWTTMELVLASFQNRLFFGVQQELCDLVRLSIINAQLARGLYNAGVKTVAALAAASAEQVVDVIRKSTPFESCKQRDIETALEAQKRVRNRSVWIQGREPMSEDEAAKILIAEARNLLREDLGCGKVELNWDKDSAVKSELPLITNDIVKNGNEMSHEEMTVKAIIKEPSNEDAKDESCVSVSNDSEESLCPGQSEKIDDNSYSLNLLDYESSSMLIEENNDLQSSGSILSLSVSNMEEPEEGASIEKSKNQRMLYLSSDSESDFNVDSKPISKLEIKTEELPSDTNESVSLFPELDNDMKVETAKDFCSASLIERFINDSHNFTLSKSTIAPETNVDATDDAMEDAIDDEESQELFESPLAKSSPFCLNGKPNRELEVEDCFKKRPRIHLEASSNFYQSCNATVCDCEVKIYDVQNLSQFLEEWLEQPYYSVAFACEKAPSIHVRTNGDIGKYLCSDPNPKATTSKSTDEVSSLLGNPVFVVGVAISWEVHSVFYIHVNSFESKQLKSVMRQGFTNERATFIVGYSLKEQLRLMFNVFECLPHSEVAYSDPKISSWLLDQDNILNFAQIVESILPAKLHLVREFIQSKQNVGLGLNLTLSRHAARIRASREADLVHQLAYEFRRKLQDVNLLHSFEEIEMRSLVSLVQLEINGMGVDVTELQRFADILRENMQKLETTAHSVVGHEFNLASPAEVSKVLYSELKLGFPNDENKTESKSLMARQSLLKGTSVSLRRQLRQRGRVATMKTNKDTLKKLTDQHELPALILTWRKIQSALSKNVIPVLKMNRYVPQWKMYRTMSYCDNLTATGRVTMSDPDVQMVPRDFTVEIPDSDDVTISLRNVFIPFLGGVLVGADFSQLELRILAELSNDPSLKLALNSGDDVFKSIAAQWRACSISEVTDSDRQNAKQICYGMIYGMGAKSLGEQLEIDPDEALEFMEEFKSKYPGVRNFISSTVEKCRQLGYVETLSGRRRYLKDIGSCAVNVRLHGERQAVNSTIQGSAADIFKKALIAVESSFSSSFQKMNDGGPRLILQLHDELVYECREDDALEAAQIMKRCMENSTRLSVILPVRVKIGPSWGKMKYIDLY